MRNIKTSCFVLFAFLIFLAPMAAAQEDPQDVRRIAEESLVCLCGCGSNIRTCPHTNCGFAIPARKEIEGLANKGVGVQEIIDIFKAKYGGDVLVAPPKEGFNMIAYAGPFAVVIIALIGVVVVMKRWTSKGLQDEANTLSHMHDEKLAEIDDQIEKELEDLD